MLEYLTRDNITLALSIFGSLGTLITFISSYSSKKKNLKIKLSQVVHRSDIGTLAVVFTFENRSQLPIAITNVSLTFDKKSFSPASYPRNVGEYAHRQGKEVIDRKFEYNLKLPVDVQQLSAVSGYVLFDIPLKEFENLSTPLTFRVSSTRGRVQKIQLQSNQIKYL